MQTKSLHRAACRDTQTFPTSGVLEDGARNFGGGEKTIFAGEKCIESGAWGTSMSREAIWWQEVTRVEGKRTGKVSKSTWSGQRMN